VVNESLNTTHQLVRKFAQVHYKSAVTHVTLRNKDPECAALSRRQRVPAKVPPFSELIKSTTTSAVHLEMRDQYTPDDPVFLNWLATGRSLTQRTPTGTSWCVPM
jgi:hypothetical protein